MIDERDDQLRAEFDRLRAEVQRMAQEVEDAEGLGMMQGLGGRGIPEWVPGGAAGGGDDFAWRVKREGGLTVSMVDGVLYSSGPPGGALTAQMVSTGDITLPNNATREIWLKAAVSNTDFATFFKLWKVDSAAVEFGVSTPASTVDPSDLDGGAGDQFVLIATVTTADGEVTHINQALHGAYTLVYPLGIDVGEFECPDPEEEE